MRLMLNIYKKCTEDSRAGRKPTSPIVVVAIAFSELLKQPTSPA
jgi:hypothetical protein